MDTTYCNKCGLLHNPNDGSCLGCEMVKELKLAKECIKKAIDLHVVETGAKMVQDSLAPYVSKYMK